jgi:hypothetical protein
MWWCNSGIDGSKGGCAGSVLGFSGSFQLKVYLLFCTNLNDEILPNRMKTHMKNEKVS